MVSLSLPKAMRLPVNVSPPMRMDRKMVTTVKVETVPECSAAQPTNRLAIPPKPLNMATISGIAVMATRRAASAPITPPVTSPRAIQRKSTMEWSSKVNYYGEQHAACGHQVAVARGGRRNSASSGRI